MISPDAPIPAGTLCTLAERIDGRPVQVRVYATIWPGVAWDGRYRLVRLGERQSCGMATRAELVVTSELRRDRVHPREARAVESPGGDAMTRPVPGWDPRPRLIDRLWSRGWPYIAAVLAGVLTAIAVLAVLAGWP